MVGPEVRHDGTNNIYVVDAIQTTEVQSLSGSDLSLDTSSASDSLRLKTNGSVAIRIKNGPTIQMGFYGATPIAQAVLATGTGKTVDNVITALQNLGLVSQA